MAPLPKEPGVRQRRNRHSTAATLAAVEPLEIPDLPARGRRRWHRFTLAWWDDVRESPMAAEYLQADLHGLFRLALLVDEFNRTPSVKTAAEIRQQEMRFGLSPIDRRRLQWTVQRVEHGATRQQQRAPRRHTDADPREFLWAVN